MKKYLSFFVACISITLIGCGGSPQSNIADGPSSIANPVTVQINPCTTTQAPTSPPFLMAIKGAGSFRLNNNGAINFIKNAQFQLELSNTLALSDCGTYPFFLGSIIAGAGNRLTGYNIGVNGVLSSVLENVNIFNAADMPPSASSKVVMQVNLNSLASPLSSSDFDATKVATYHHTSGISVIDTLGHSHPLQMYFIKTSVNKWDVFVVNDESLTKMSSVPYVSQIAQITFDINGNLSSTSPSMPIVVSLPVTTGAVTPLMLVFNPSGTTQFAAAFNIIQVSQDGFPQGSVAGFTVNTDGKVIGSYTNGQTRLISKIAIID